MLVIYCGHGRRPPACLLATIISANCVLVKKYLCKSKNTWAPQSAAKGTCDQVLTQCPGEAAGALRSALRAIKVFLQHCHFFVDTQRQDLYKLVIENAMTRNDTKGL